MKDTNTLEQIVGKQYTVTTTVTWEHTAEAVGSGALPVFATPMMIALMENAAAAILAMVLPEGSTSVGTAIAITHSRATALGKTVSATATVTAVDRRRIDFDVAACDETGEIGTGTHSRFVVNTKDFLEKL